MYEGKKRQFIRLGLFLALLLVGSTLCSATDLTFETMFPECSDNTNVTGSFMGAVRCGCYFLVPNFHFEALWNLVVDATVGSIDTLGTHVIDSVWTQSLDNVPNDLLNLDAGALMDDIISLVKTPFTAPLVLLYGIFSSVFVYLLLLTFEFVKTYLIISVSWLLWSEVIFKQPVGDDLLSNPKFMAFAVVGVLVVGSILLLVFDITVWGMI